MYPVILHGSENSLDIDAYVIVPEPMTMQEAKKLCDSYKEINANLLSVKDGVVVWSYKGTVDECNNSILATYHLHKQEHPSPITQKLERSYGLKMIRTVRGLLSYHSRTDIRDQVKKALQTPDMDFKLDLMLSIDLRNVADYQKTSLVETYKFFAFQIGQTLALLKDNVELFTKNSVADYYPALRPYLERREGYPVDDLQKHWAEFASYLKETVKKVYKQELYTSNYQGVREVFDCKKEVILPPVVVFDIDGTLFDESHRKEHREAKDWDTYFSLAKHDSPIQHIIDLTKEYRKKGFEIWLMSGRREEILEDTIKQANDHGVCFDKIKLRSFDNRLPDYVVKPAWISKYIGLERVVAVYDDTDRVIEGFRKKGLNVIDVKTLKPTQTVTKKTKFKP
jgi:hypothetical protein